MTAVAALAARALGSQEAGEAACKRGLLQYRVNKLRRARVVMREEMRRLEAALARVDANIARLDEELAR